MSIIQGSHSRYANNANSSLDIFDKISVLERVLSSYTQELFPSISLDKNSFEFGYAWYPTQFKASIIQRKTV